MHHNQHTQVDDLFNMDSEIDSSFKQDMLYQSIMGLMIVRRIGNVIAKVSKKHNPINQQDVETRDILFGGGFKDERDSPNMFMYTN